MNTINSHHVLLVAPGPAGDVHPLLAVGQALLARGHRVTLFANAVFAPLAERCGMRLRAVGSESDHHRTMTDPAMWRPRTAQRTLWNAMAGHQRQLFDLLDAAAGPRTIMLGSPWAFAARLVHEKLGVPYLSTQVSPATLLSAIAPPVQRRFPLPPGLPHAARSMLLRLAEMTVLDRTFGPALNTLRRQLGLEPVDRIMRRWVHSPQGVLALFPDWYAPPQPDWPGRTTLTGFPLFDSGGLDGLDEPLKAFLAVGSAPVVITPGPDHPNGAAFFNAALDAVRHSGRRAVLIGQGIPRAAATLPGVMSRAEVPLRALLPHASAVIHQGDIGTTSLALAEGTPQVVLPLAHDHFDNAARLNRLGVARVVQAGGPSQHLARVLLEVLDDGELLARCAARQRQMPSPREARERAAQAIEALGAEG